MYNYIKLTDDIREMMVMMSSLPTCTLVFDKNASLIDINQPALNFLKITNKDNYLKGISQLPVEHFYIKRTIDRLKTGRLISNENLKFILSESNTVTVKFNANMLYGKTTLFIFQFFEQVILDEKKLHSAINERRYELKKIQLSLNELENKLLFKCANKAETITNKSNTVIVLKNEEKS